MSRDEEKRIQPPLRSIYFYPTESCNLRCIHCWLRPSYAPDEKFYEQQNQDNIGVDTMDAVVREALPLGLKAVKLTGGEPFLNPHIFDFIECFSEHKLMLSFETNGTLLYPETVERLKEFNATQISVSLDGSNSTTHERIRGRRGSFEMALKGIRLLIKNHIYPQVIFCLQRMNVHELEDTIRLVEGLGVRSFEINPLATPGKEKPLSRECDGLSLDELVELEKRVESTLNPRFRHMDIDLYLPPSFKSMGELSRNNFSTCRIHNICAILSNGDVSICGIGRRNSDFVMGNVRDRSIEEIWRKGSLFKEIREKIPFDLKGVCGRCLFKHHCLGFCRADVMTDIQSLTDPFVLCEELYEKGLFPGTRLLTEREISRISNVRRESYPSD